MEFKTTLANLTAQEVQVGVDVNMQIPICIAFDPMEVMDAKTYRQAIIENTKSYLDQLPLDELASLIDSCNLSYASPMQTGGTPVSLELKTPFEAVIRSA